MKRYLGFVMVMMMGMVMVFGAGAAGAGMFPDQDAKIKYFKVKEVAAGKLAAKYRAEAAKANAESKVNDAAEKNFAVGAARAKAAKETSMAEQDQVCTVVGWIPVVGTAMRYYNEGEVQASLAGKGNESYWGVIHALFKTPASFPEFCAFDLGYRVSGANWRELDPASVFFVNGRPYWMDAAVIGTKVFYGLSAGQVIHPFGHVAHHAYKAHHLFHVRHAHYATLPTLGHAAHAPLIQAAYWVNLTGGSLNLLTGAGYEAAKGMTPYRAYYKSLEWRTGKPATMPVIL